MNLESKIFVAGHNGLLGSAIVRNLKKKGYKNVLTISKKELDLKNTNSVDNYFNLNKPEFVFLAAAKVGGIMANNTYPAEFIYDNISIQNNVIHTSYLNNVKKLLFVGSGCVYPKIVPQPIREDYLLTGPLEKTNESYAIAKIAGLKMCEAYNKQYGTDFISVMPCNVYGENDSYHLENAHVVPALIRKFHEAVENEKDNVEIWGTGKARREFIHVDDLADACVYLMSNYTSNDPINIGVGFDITIKDLANLIAEISKFKGKLIYDYSKPDGTPQKLLDSSKLISMGWKPKISLIEGLSGVYKAYKDNHLNYRK